MVGLTLKPLFGIGCVSFFTYFFFCEICYLSFLPFHTVHVALKARILKWFAIPFSTGPCFVRTLYHDHQSWVALHGMAHSFTELDKAVVHVVRLKGTTEDEMV